MAVRLPSAVNVQRVDPGITRDPGVQAPAAAFGAAEGQVIEGLGEQFSQIADRQLSRQEAVEAARAYELFNREADSELRRLSTEDDFSREDVVRNYGSFLATKQAELLGEFGGRAGASTRLQARLIDLESRYRGQAAALSTKAGLDLVERTLEQQIRPLAAEAARDPSRLDDLFLQADEMVGMFAPALAPDQEAAVRSAARETVARSAIDAAMMGGDFDAAEQMLDVGGLANVLSPETQSGIRRQIGMARFEQGSLEREIAVAESRLGRPLTQQELATKLGIGGGSGEPLEVVADPTSETGVRFVPRSQAAGQPAPAKSPLVQFDTGADFGTVPTGMARVEDKDSPTGTRLVREPGGAADIEAQREEIRAVAAQEDEAIRAQATVRNIDQAQQLIDQGAGGPEAALTAHIPGTKAFQLDRHLDQIKARVGFDTLQKMRDASPTGGALGQVSENENRLLQSARGSLDVRQDPPVLSETLRQIRETELNAWYGTPAEHERAIAEGKMTEEEAAELQRQRQTVGFDAIGRPVEGDETTEQRQQEPGTAEAASPEETGDVPLVDSFEAYSALPAGARYTTGDGKIRVKGQ